MMVVACSTMEVGKTNLCHGGFKFKNVVHGSHINLGNFKHFSVFSHKVSKVLHHLNGEKIALHHLPVKAAVLHNNVCSDHS